MAILTGPFKMKGSIGDLSFYTTKDGICVVRGKTGPTPKQVKTDPAFQRTRENSREFARAQEAASLIRRALHPELKYTGDYRCFTRLRSLMIDLIKRDTVSPRGNRMLTSSAFPLLTGFEYNGTLAFTAAFRAPYTAAINRDEGHMRVLVPSFIPSMRIANKQEATHAKLFILGVSLDFEGDKYQRTELADTFIALHKDSPQSIVLETRLIASMTGPLVLVLGIRYYREEGPDRLIPLEDRSGNAMAIVAVD